jgi:hypothetical protein
MLTSRGLVMYVAWGTTGNGSIYGEAPEVIQSASAQVQGCQG